MRLSPTYLSLLINFLLGASWAFVFLGAVTLFFMLYHNGFLNALFGSFVGAFPGLFFVVMLEFLVMQYEKHDEFKKQTKLLEEIANR